MKKPENTITFRSLLIGTLIAALFSFITVYFENRKGVCLTSTQVAVLPYVLLLFTVVLLNPFLRVVKLIRTLTAAETLIIFIMGSVSAGCSTFGLGSQLVPVISGLFNEHWNNEQTGWNQYVEPFVNDVFFLAEDGITDAAKVYHRDLTRLKRDRRIYESAVYVSRMMQNRKKAGEKIKRVKAMPLDEARMVMELNQARMEFTAAKQAEREAKARWRAVADQVESDSPDTVLASYPKRLVEEQAAANASQKKLARLERKAFAKVDRFRRGLPEGLRAFPGMIPLPDESFGVYLYRLQRLRAGLSSLASLRTALDRVKQKGGETLLTGEDRQLIQKLLTVAGKRLEPIADETVFQQNKQKLDIAWKQRNEDILKLRSKMKALRQERRSANSAAFSHLDSEIRRLARQENKKVKKQARTERELEQCKINAQAAAVVVKVRRELQQLNDDLAKGTLRCSEVVTRLKSIRAEYRYFDASLQRFLIGDVPWSQWFKPLFFWGLLVGLTYLILMTFNVLIFRQWAHNERLIYPLAELPKVLVGVDSRGNSDHTIPYAFRSGLFWTGFCISAAVLSWNLLCATKLVPGLPALDLTIKWGPYIQDSMLSGLIPGARSSIFFTMIGFAFLIPSKISFSLWFFSLFYMLQLLILVGLGYGVNERSFPVDWWYTLNFRTAEGGGALLVFSVVIFYKCRKYIFCCLRPKTVQELDRDEQRELRWSSFLFITGSLALILGLWLELGANIWYTIFGYLVIMMITIGLIRAVTEGGILGFQAWVSPFHFIRTLFGMDKAWTSPSLFAPIMIYYSLLFLDIKTFIAPAMANSIKIRDDLKMKRGRFHLAIFFGILAACVTAVLVHIMMGYNKGGDAMNGWFYTGFPRGLFNQIAAMTRTHPVDNTACRLWMLGGGVAMGALLYFRQAFFWLPHPIGLIMLVNPIMRVYWFSIFLGWLAKTLATKYGNRESYEKVKLIFIGLIVGELCIVVLAMVVAYTMGIQIPIDLNRN